jgi:NifB/MoaA-like Fe-S oxidoreductase
MGVRFVYPTDEWYLVSEREVPPVEAYDGQELQENGLGMVRRFLDEWAEVQTEITQFQGDLSAFRQSLTLVTGTLFAPVLEAATAEFSQQTGATVHVQPIINQRLGDTITAAGLLMAQDVVQQLKTAGYGDLVLLPRVMFDHPDVIALDDTSPQQVANELNRPVILADLMGDVWDALIGKAGAIFLPLNENN